LRRPSFTYFVLGGRRATIFGISGKNDSCLSENPLNVGKGNMSDNQIWLLVLPLILIELGLMIFALVDLVRRPRVKGGNKWLWVIVIVLINIVGPLVYFVVGREEE
jgi:hypothetical protein